MNTARITKTTAAALIASSLFAEPAFATPASGRTVTNVVNGQFGEIQENTAGQKTDKWGMILKTLDATDVGADKITLEPQGTTGWHSHPAPVFVTVTQGTIEWTESLLCTPRTFTVGQTILETTGRVHVARNPAGPGGQVAEFIAVRIKPTSAVGPAFSIDAPVPNNCQ